MTPLVTCERDERGIATVVLNRPEQRNAVSTAMLDELVKTFGDLAGDRDVRVAILAGSGPDFCAGADFSEVTIMGPPALDYARSFEEAIHSVTRLAVPVVARVHGAALGAGCQLVVACDLAVAAEDAKLGIPAARLGLLINFENVQRLVLAVGSKRAGEILFTARALTGREAAEWGLVNHAVPAAELERATADLAVSVAEGAPLTVRGSKRGIAAVLDNLSVNRERDAKPVEEFDAMAAEALESADLQEGIAAFRERRKPRFSGT